MHEASSAGSRAQRARRPPDGVRNSEVTSLSLTTDGVNVGRIRQAKSLIIRSSKDRLSKTLLPTRRTIKDDYEHIDYRYYPLPRHLVPLAQQPSPFHRPLAARPSSYLAPSIVQLRGNDDFRECFLSRSLANILQPIGRDRREERMKDQSVIISCVVTAARRVGAITARYLKNAITLQKRLSTERVDVVDAYRLTSAIHQTVELGS